MTASKERSYIETLLILVIGAASLVYLWQWLAGEAPAPAPLATLPGAAQSGAPLAVTGRPLTLYTAR
jgi:hypothetical protein